MAIRSERESDQQAVHALNASAFASDAEARLVDRLRLQTRPLISLVAEDGQGQIVGHILFTPVSLQGEKPVAMMGLAPMAVAPRRQGEGIGKDLVHAGLDQCRQLHMGAVVVLGHPGYYPRFGFQPASSFGLSCVYDAPDEAFMALELEPGYLGTRTGTVHYHPAFDSLP